MHYSAGIYMIVMKIVLDIKGLILLQLNSIYFKSKISNHVAVRLFACLGMSRVGWLGPHPGMHPSL